MQKQQVGELDVELGRALVGSLTANGAVRQQAETVLQSRSKQLGHCMRLLALSQANCGLQEEARLLAAMMVKNEILMRWRPGSRGIPEADRPAIRAALTERLTHEEPSEKVSGP
jgi:hypothetical protein